MFGNVVQTLHKNSKQTKESSTISLFQNHRKTKCIQVKRLSDGIFLRRKLLILISILIQSINKVSSYFYDDCPAIDNLFLHKIQHFLFGFMHVNHPFPRHFLFVDFFTISFCAENKY